MVNNTNRFSTQTAGSSGGSSQGGDKTKELWSSMLDSVASGRRLPEKNLLLLGGSVDSQREFLESLSAGDGTGGRGGRSGALDAAAGINGGVGGNATRAPVANHFALGYTYYDVLDTDAEDTLARISLYTLTSAAPAFGALLAPLLTPAAIPHTLIVVLLDWAEPWRWMRQLRRWILLLRTVLVSLPDEAKEAMEEAMLAWRDRGRGGGTNLDGTSASAAAPGASSEGDVALPLGPGEWEDALGLPLCVVCQNAEKMEILEKTQGWKEEEFDAVLQYMRTVLLRHGASLIYTTPSAPSQLPTLVHSSLGIHSLLKKQPLKHNVIDRDKILVPPNWDSWGKIRVLREGFDVETVSTGWSIDLDQPYPLPRRGAANNNGAADANGENGGGGGGGFGFGAVVSSSGSGSDDVSAEKAQCADPEGSTVTLYERAVQDPSMDALQQMAGRGTHSAELEVDTTDTQTFLAQQLELLEKYRQKSEEAARKAGGGGGQGDSQRFGAGAGAASSTRGARLDEDDGGRFLVGESKVNEHIGPVQFNMGGIQVDADDMMKRLKNRQAYNSSPEPDGQEADQAGEETHQLDSENLQAFFADLMNRKQKK